MINEFFAYARERHAIHLRRSSGAPGPWTEDPVLQAYRFCNVFRELDKTTEWFRTNVRDPLRNRPEVLLATVVFRLFNRIRTGEAIFQQPDLLGGDTAWFMMMTELDMGCESFIDPLRYAIKAYCGNGPYTTGSYMTKTPTGMNKLNGMLQVIEWFVTQAHEVPGSTPFLGGTPIQFEWLGAAKAMLQMSWVGSSWSLEDAWGWLRQFPFIGDFTAYEIVTDLRHTALLDRAPDIMTWANPGPGCKKGLNRVFRGDPDKNVPREQWILEMRELLRLSQDPKYWPADWPAWELREAEMWSCEMQKLMRVKEGGAPPRQRFRGGM